VEALLDAGADVHLTNKSGSTPLHLAVQNTGRSGSGSPDAIEQQRLTLILLCARGGKPQLMDGFGKTVIQAATAGWIRDFLQTRD
jgi:ankyrin repeat protein